MTGIYKITNPSKKVYIGQSVNIEKRFISYKKLRCKAQIALYRSLVKYGVENHVFEILCECEVSELNKKERYYQDLYSVLDNGLNCILTKCDERPRIHSAETRKKMSESGKNRVTSEQAKESMRKSSTGRVFTQEVKDKMSSTRKGRFYSEEHKASISKGLKGRKLSESHRLKILEYRKSLKNKTNE